MSVCIDHHIEQASGPTNPTASFPECVFTSQAAGQAMSQATDKPSLARVRAMHPADRLAAAAAASGLQMKLTRRKLVGRRVLVSVAHLQPLGPVQEAQRDSGGAAGEGGRRSAAALAAAADGGGRAAQQSCRGRSCWSHTGTCAPPAPSLGCGAWQPAGIPSSRCLESWSHEMPLADCRATAANISASHKQRGGRKAAFQG